MGIRRRTTMGNIQSVVVFFHWVGVDLFSGSLFH